jgi:hypothetical protein
MALRGTVVAAIFVAVALVVGQPAEGSRTCGIHRCISECPSKCNKKAATSCGGAGGADEREVQVQLWHGLQRQLPYMRLRRRMRPSLQQHPGPYVHCLQVYGLRRVQGLLRKGLQG